MIHYGNSIFCLILSYIYHFLTCEAVFTGTMKC